MKRPLFIFFVLPIALTLSSCGGEKHYSYTYLKSEEFEPSVRNNLNSMFDLYGKESSSYNESNKPYCVFDFDNTVSLFDSTYALFAYSVENLTFPFIDGESLINTVLVDVSIDALVTPLTSYTLESRSSICLNDIATDVAISYDRLYKKGYVGIPNKHKRSEFENDDDYLEFASKIVTLFNACEDNFSSETVYQMETYYWCGLTEDEIKALCEECYSEMLDSKDYKKKTYDPPKGEYDSLAGKMSASFKWGLSISNAIKELWKALDENGFETYVCSASERIFVDTLALNPSKFGLIGCDGVYGLENVFIDDKMSNKMDTSIHPVTQGIGKSITVANLLAKSHGGKGPILCAGDSEGDINFLSEFKDTKVALCLNRVKKDAFAVPVAAGMYQVKNGLDLAMTSSNGDTLYLVQGRDENKGTLIPKHSSIALEEGEEKTLSSVGEDFYYYMNNNGLSIKDTFNKIPTYFTKTKYNGYKTR